MKTLVGIIIGISVLGCANDAEKLFSAQGGGGSSSEGGSDSAGGAGEGGEGGEGSASGQGGQNAGGSGGEAQTSSSSGSCIPKTCETIAVELNGGTQGDPKSCGLILDGCNNYIDCGGCQEENKYCPDSSSTDVQNLCSDNCFLAQNQNMIQCDAGNFWWDCKVPTNNKPKDSCYNANSNQSLPSAWWCCN